MFLNLDLHLDLIKIAITQQTVRYYKSRVFFVRQLICNIAKSRHRHHGRSAVGPTTDAEKPDSCGCIHPMMIAKSRN